MKVTIIFTTYNSPEWLKKVLWGYQQQTFTDFELIIADDGSTPDTRNLIDTMRPESPFEIHHVWHEDNGFQKCRILNKAILHARGDYLIFSDGDCIPRRDFIETHVRQAEPGRYLSGSYFKLPLETSKKISREEIISGICFGRKWLLQNGLPHQRKTWKISSGPRLAKIFNRLTPVKCNFKGSNGSAWREDVLAVNGFDERMQWGGLDREFGARLINRGIKPKHVRFDAICLHLDHPRSYQNAAMVKANKELRQKSEREKTIRTPCGIQQLLDAGYTIELHTGA